jgi:hypothetical protein
MRFVLLFLLFGMTLAEETNEESRRRADEALAENTRQLHEAFRTRDATRESHLYVERREILVRRRDLRPASAKPPIVSRGFVEGFQAARLSLRREGFHDQLWVGPVYKREVREAYLALEVGDEVELVFTEQPDPLSDERYGMELTGVRHIGVGEKQIQTLSLERNFRTEASLLRVASHRVDGATTYLAIIRNVSREEWKLGEGKGVRVRVTNASDVDEKLAATIAPAKNLLHGEVLTLQIEVAALPTRVSFLSLEVLAPDNSRIISTLFPLRRSAD